MNPTARFRQFLERYAAKDLPAIASLLAPQATLRDWNVSVRGRDAVLAETQKNFEAARTIGIEVLRLHDAGSSVAGELRIVVDGEIELYAIDILDFDASGQVTAIRAYKGRGD